MERAVTLVYECRRPDWNKKRWKKENGGKIHEIFGWNFSEATAYVTSLCYECYVNLKMFS